MGEPTPATTQTTGSSQPWSPATPLLTSLISKYGSMDTGVTPGQTNALTNLNASAAGIPDLGPTATAGVQKLFGSDSSPQVGMLGQGYDTLRANLGDTASGKDLNPYTTPGFGDALSTLTDNITKATKGVYAGSGRDPTGAGSFAGSLGRGLMQGEAPIIQSQFNTNKSNQMDAAKTLFSGAGSTAGGTTAAQQASFANILQGLGGAGMLPGIYTSPSTAQVGAANALYSQPFQNLTQLLTPSLGMAALGTNTTGTSTMTPANNPLNNIIGGISAGAGLAGTLFSDIETKEDVEHVGKLNDGQNIYSYKYKGDDTPRLGLIAQEVLEHVPEAVHDVGGVLAVDYPLAMRRAKSFKVGMIDREAA
jgi:hypothetical protein